MFDVPIREKASLHLSAEVPGADEDWTIGLIVGPSGSGKSSVAREAFGAALYEGGGWDDDSAVVDGFGSLSTKDSTGLLSAVGFSSPPSWVKPYRVLSNGERFRCDLARALASADPLVVYDEFTSVVDRVVAKIGSAAVSKAIRKRKDGRRFVAVSCHYGRRGVAGTGLGSGHGGAQPREGEASTAPHQDHDHRGAGETDGRCFAVITI